MEGFASLGLRGGGVGLFAVAAVFDPNSGLVETLGTLGRAAMIAAIFIDAAAFARRSVPPDRTRSDAAWHRLQSVVPTLTRHGDPGFAIAGRF